MSQQSELCRHEFNTYRIAKLIVEIIILSLSKEEFRKAFCSSLDHIRGPAQYVLASNVLEVSKGM